MLIRDLIKMRSHPEMAHTEGMVYQVWEDGEITLQKSGTLLNQRTLHCIEPGLLVAVNPEFFAHKLENGHAFIYTDKDGAYAVRAAILGLSIYC